MSRFSLRLCSFLVTLSWIVCIACLIIFNSQPAAAASLDHYWIDLVDYGGFISGSNSYGSGTYFSPSPGLSYHNVCIPQLMSVKYVDLIIYAGSGWLPAGLDFKVWGNSLSVVKYGPYENYWRLYGPISTPSAQVSTLRIDVTNPYSGNLNMDLLSCRISSSIPFTDISADISLYTDSFSDSFKFPTYDYTDWPTTVTEPGNLRIDISSSQWLVYDHLDFMLRLDVTQIDGITASIDTFDGFIPLSYQYLNNSGIFSETYNMVSVSLDLSNVKPSNNPLKLYITFHTAANTYSALHVYSIHGWSSTNIISSESFWFSKLISTFKSSISGAASQLESVIMNTQSDLISAIIQGFSSMTVAPESGSAPAPAPDTVLDQENISSGIGQIDSDLDAIATIPRPDLDSIDLPSSHLSDINYDTNVAHLTMLTHAEPFRLIFFFAALFMVVGVVIYGRRS